MRYLDLNLNLEPPEEINVLSLFDGISCGRLALKRAGIEVKKYYSSEIDKYAIAVAKYNFPDTIFLGDIRKINKQNLPKIDLLIGGSPCTDLSVSGKRQGMATKNKIQINSLKQYLKLKKEGIDFIGQSYLFWEYVRLLKILKPKYFFLENVKMKKEWRDIISKAVGVEPIEINSALVSAQQRKRLYWTNIPVKGLPQDKHIYLKDIIETGFTEREKAYCLTKTYGNACLRDYFLKHSRQLIFKEKKAINSKKELYLLKPYVRKLTPVECERLQTLPDNYTRFGNFDGKIKEISKTQRYKMIGNAWTVDVISWFFKFLSF